MTAFFVFSVRSTNVYEERSLGVFEEDDESVDEEAFKADDPKTTIWSRYLAMHMRRQLSFGEFVSTKFVTANSY